MKNNKTNIFKTNSELGDDDVDRLNNAYKHALFINYIILYISDNKNQYITDSEDKKINDRNTQRNLLLGCFSYFKIHKNNDKYKDFIDGLQKHQQCHSFQRKR
jgi:hypothetical protein